MRRICYFIGRLTIAAIIILPFGLTAPVNAETVPQAVQVLRVKGHARYSVDNKTWQPLKKGDVLPPTVMIQTAAKSTVDIQPGDENAAPTSIDADSGSIRAPDELKANTIRVYENSVLDIAKLTSDRANAAEVSETQLDLRAGRMMGAVRKSPNASRYEIKFLNGVAGVRDGVYILSSSGSLDVLYGTTIVVLEAADGSSPAKIVTANHQFDPATGVVAEIHSPLPVESPETNSGEAASARPVAPVPFQGPGMGGSLRKF